MDSLVWRALRGLFRWLGVQASLRVGLMLLIAQMAAFGIGEVLREIDARLLFPFLLAALLLTWTLHSLRTADWLAALLLPFSGAAVVMLSLGRLAQPLLQVGQALLKVRLVQLEEQGWQVLWGSLPETSTTLAQTAQVLISRLVSWGSGFYHLTPTFDPLAASLAWSLCAWLLAAWMGWLVLRHNYALLGLFPLTALLAWALYFTHAPGNWLLVVLALGGMLQILTVHFQHIDRWQGADLTLPDNRFELAGTAVLLVGSLALSAWLVSNFSLRSVERFLRELLPASQAVASSPSDAIGQALGMQLQPEPANPFSRALQPTLPSQHLLRGGPELSQNLVMWVALEGFPAVPQAAAPGAPRPPTYYWRSLSYNRYNGRGWYTDATETVGYQAGQPLDETLLQNATAEAPRYRFIQQQVRVFRQGGGTLYYTGELLNVDQNYQVAWRRLFQHSDFLGAVVESDQYTALSRRVLVDPDLLRQAGTAYPEWVIDRYLSLPESLPDRVRNLALDLTATQLTPYDRASAIEIYLRKTYTYSLDLPEPPTNRDLVDYFLFEMNEGYCDYYASSMTVLARAAGVPARLVTGYSSGTWVSDQGHLVITEADAHSWVEIYFPGYGWVEFEPTAGRAPLERSNPAEIQQASNEPADLTLPTQPDWREYWQDWLASLRSAWLQLLLAAWLLILVGFRLEEWWLRLLKPQAAVRHIYRRVYRQAARLGIYPLPGGTLREFTRRLVFTLESFAQVGLWRMDFARQAEDVRWLSDLYERTLFSPHLPDRQEHRRCVKAWRRMRGRWWLARLHQRLFRVGGQSPGEM